MNKSVGSLSGAHAEDGTLVCSLFSKYSTKVERTLSVVHSVSVSVLVFSSEVVENSALGLKKCCAWGTAIPFLNGNARAFFVFK